jgi:diaminopimelate epimerase
MSGRIRITVPVAASSARPISLRLPTGAPDWLPAEGWFLTVGVPHLVLLLDARHCTSLAALDLTSCAPQLRRLDALGEPGANVNFLLQQKNEAFALRTWERGVEGETLACGSGAVASALVAVQSGVAAWPVEIEVRSGDRLEIGNEWAAAAASLTRADSATRDPGARTREPCFWQEGPATVVARGELLPPGLPPSSSSPARSHGGAC